MFNLVKVLIRALLLSRAPGVLIFVQKRLMPPMLIFAERLAFP
jgi:hypothetical protein